MKYSLHTGDNVAVLQQIEDNAYDACITDPPYGMDIAGVGWDKNVPPTETWSEIYRVLKPGAFVLSFCNPEYYHRMATKIEDAGFKPLDMVMWMITTKMAKKNRLKPAHEPIMVAQKPLDGSIDANFAKWGTGKICIDSNRIPWDKEPPKGWVKGGHQRRNFGGEVARARDNPDRETVDANPAGRYPSNIIGYFDDPDHQKYFYAPRVSRAERGEYNTHPTPKPIDLMRYLIRVYSPQGGHVLDPFLGSGSTGIAAIQEGRHFTGIDLSPEYVSIATRRIDEHTQADLDENFFEIRG